jgi:hypothetical protein
MMSGSTTGHPSSGKSGPSKIGRAHSTILLATTLAVYNRLHIIIIIYYTLYYYNVVIVIMYLSVLAIDPVTNSP